MDIVTLGAAMNGVNVAIAGKQDKITPQNKISADNVDDSNSTHKFATANQLSQITTNTTDIATIQQNIGDINTVLEEVL